MYSSVETTQAVALPKNKDSFRRLHIAASRFEHLEAKTLNLMANSSWVHLGEPASTWQARLRNEFGVRNWRNCAQILYRVLKPRYNADELESYYKKTLFLPFSYRAGDRFDFEDQSFDFIYSEHFFEHLFEDEALALLQECARMLKPGGVLRIVVPDADLRTYDQPESVGFPGARLAWDHPDKHKTRWSVYSLPLALEAAGLRANPLVYCDKHGAFIRRQPSEEMSDYQTSSDKEMIYSFEYVRRPQSLIVDGIKMVA